MELVGLALGLLCLSLPAFGALFIILAMLKRGPRK